jgi:hypothetical protein
MSAYFFVLLHIEVFCLRFSEILVPRKNFQKFLTSEVTILELASSTLSFTIACVYRPPSRALLQDDMILFHKLSELSATAANLFSAGDFNLPMIDWSSTDYLNIKKYADNSAAYHFVETLINSSLCQIVSEPTRFRQN